MNALSRVLAFKISATLLFWSLPLILLPADLIEAAGFPHQDSYMFVRMLGWAYLALCVGYGFALHESLQGRRALAQIWVGIVSNGGAFGYLAYYGLSGAWSTWDPLIQLIAWNSVVATLLITLGLWRFGLRGAGAAD